MKIRSFIYLIVFLLIGLLIFKYGEGQEIVPPESVSKQDILTDFADLQDNDIPAGTLGGTYFTTAVSFPDDFVGDQGDEFYVSMEDGHVALTQRYIIEQIGASEDKSGKLIYKLKANFENFTPPAGKYETHKYDGKSWSKVPATKKQ